MHGRPISVAVVLHFVNPVRSWRDLLAGARQAELIGHTHCRKIGAGAAFCESGSGPARHAMLAYSSWRAFIFPQGKHLYTRMTGLLPTAGSTPKSVICRPHASQIGSWGPSLEPVGIALSLPEFHAGSYPENYRGMPRRSGQRQRS